MKICCAPAENGQIAAAGFLVGEDGKAPLPDTPDGRLRIQPRDGCTCCVVTV